MAEPRTAMPSDGIGKARMVHPDCLAGRWVMDLVEYKRLWAEGWRENLEDCAPIEVPSVEDSRMVPRRGPGRPRKV